MLVRVEPLAFYDPAMFPWTRSFEGEYERLRVEAQYQLEIMSPLYPTYVETAAGLPTKTSKWFGQTIVFFTIKNRSVLANMPVTSHLLDQVPNLVSAVLLRMEGDTHLKPHGGFSPDVLRCHFGLIVPEPDACTLRVTNERRNWLENEWLVFDDYLEHEAWNKGTSPRLVLMLDVVRPEVARNATTIAERFFNQEPEIRYEHDLDQVAPREQWLSWVRAGEFSPL
jgi:ornithine lipid ester-linked acyl 2-hydroxylase